MPSNTVLRPVLVFTAVVVYVALVCLLRPSSETRLSRRWAKVLTQPQPLTHAARHLAAADPPGPKPPVFPGFPVLPGSPTLPPPPVPPPPPDQPSDFLTLLTIRAELGEPPVLQSWSNSSSTSLCQLEYVLCCTVLQPDSTLQDPEPTNHVCGLNFSSLALPGSLTLQLPDSIQLLHDSLVFLDLSNNSFEGPIPLSWMSLKYLQVMSLDSNSLSGALASSPLSHLTSLQRLSVASNVFSTGTVPAQFSLLKDLTHLNLSSIPSLSGTLPAAYSALSDLQSLSLAFNPHIEGTVPAVWPQGMTALTRLVLNDTMGLCGPVPQPSFAAQNGTENGTSIINGTMSAINGSALFGNGTINVSLSAWSPAVMGSNGTIGPGYLAGGSGIGVACPPTSPISPPLSPAPPALVQHCDSTVLGHVIGDKTCSSLFFRGDVYVRFANYRCPTGEVVTQVTHKRGTYVWYNNVQAELQVTLVCSDGTVLQFPPNVTRTATNVFSAPSYNSSDGFQGVAGTISCLTENLIWLPASANATAVDEELFRCANSTDRIAGVTVSYGYVFNTWEFCCAAPNFPPPVPPPPGQPAPPGMPPIIGASPSGPSPSAPSSNNTTLLVVAIVVSVVGSLLLALGIIGLLLWRKRRWRQRSDLSSLNTPKLTGGSDAPNDTSSSEHMDDARPAGLLYFPPTPNSTLDHAGLAACLAVTKVQLAAADSAPQPSSTLASARASLNVPPSLPDAAPESGMTDSGGGSSASVHGVILSPSTAAGTRSAAPTPTMLCMDSSFEAQLRTAYHQLMSDYTANGSPLGPLDDSHHSLGSPRTARDDAPHRSVALSASSLRMPSPHPRTSALVTAAAAGSTDEAGSGGSTIATLAGSISCGAQGEDLLEPVAALRQSHSDCTLWMRRRDAQMSVASGRAGAPDVMDPLRALTSASGTVSPPYSVKRQVLKLFSPSIDRRSLAGTPAQVAFAAAAEFAANLSVSGRTESVPLSPRKARVSFAGLSGRDSVDLARCPPRRVRLDLKLHSDVSMLANQILGSGAMGVVWRGVFEGQDVAVKVIRPPAGSDEEFLMDLDNFKSEIMIMSRLEHRNVVTLHGASLKPPQMFLVEELMSGSLMRFIHTRPPRVLPLPCILQLAIDILAGLAYLHSLHVLHRDLKPANVLLALDGTAKISDFGLARGKQKSYLSTKRVDAGTVAYMAPECFNQDLGRITAATDMFAFGVILWELVTQQRPWRDVPQAAIIFRVVLHNARLPLPDDPARCPPELAALVQRCWSAAPSGRPSAAAARQELIDMLNGLVASGAVAHDDINKTLATLVSEAAAAAKEGPSLFPHCFNLSDDETKSSTCLTDL